MTKRELKLIVKQAFQLKEKSFGTEVAFNVYSNSLYILDTEEDNVIEMTRTEAEAESICNSLNEGNKGCVYYKPILIDEDSGERITRKTFKLYLKK
jgi:hypothetical protein